VGKAAAQQYSYLNTRWVVAATVVVIPAACSCFNQPSSDSPSNYEFIFVVRIL
jgi:hypothetical protein